MNAVVIAKPGNALGEFFMFSRESLVANGSCSSTWPELPEQTRSVIRVSVPLRSTAAKYDYRRMG
jgi:hypothetical protein